MTVLTLALILGNISVASAASGMVNFVTSGGQRVPDTYKALDDTTYNKYIQTRRKLIY
jgi:hypothetical protein